MYYVPLRKCLKIFIYDKKKERTCLSSKECLDAIPNSRRRHSRRWQLLIFIVFVCLYIVFYHKRTPDMLYVIQNVSTNIIDPNRFPVQIVHDPTLKVDVGNGTTVDILKNIGGNVDEPIQVTTTNNGILVCGSAVRNDTIRDNLISEVALGGYYYPKECRSRHKVAVLVPYRNREKHLAVFTTHMHPFLIKQQLEYRIFIIEQAGTELFNRGKLFNIGFTEMMKYNDWHCVVLHDVDLLPQSDRILYTCPTFPRHMCGTVLEKAKLTYQQYHTLFGGVSALSVEHYKQINGFSNLYWGWGGEDNDMFWRIQSTRIPIVRYNKSVALFKSLPHAGQPKNKYRYKLLAFTVSKYKTDGLSSLVYEVIGTKYHHLYTHILADANPLKENITDVYYNMFGFIL